MASTILSCIRQKSLFNNLGFNNLIFLLFSNSVAITGLLAGFEWREEATPFFSKQPEGTVASGGIP